MRQKSTLSSFAFSRKEVSPEFIIQVLREVEENVAYFRRFNPFDYELAMHEASLHALDNFDPEKGSLHDYILKLARTILKRYNKKVVLDDFSDDSIYLNNVPKKEGVKIGMPDDPVFLDKLLDKTSKTEDSCDLEFLMIEYVKDFYMFANELVNGREKGERHFNYEEQFKKSLRECARTVVDFTPKVRLLYRRYEGYMRQFLSTEHNCEWKRLRDVNRKPFYSSRYTLMNRHTGLKVQDADIEPWAVCWKVPVPNKAVYKVGYSDVFDMCIDMVDSDTSNPLKLVVNEDYRLRTPGGLVSDVDADLFDWYEAIKLEIILNVLRLMNGNLLNCGSENIYLISNAGRDTGRLSNITFGSFAFSFPVEEIEIKQVEEKKTEAGLL